VIPRYELSEDTERWIAEWFGSDDPACFTPNEVSGLITRAIGDDIITGGPAGTDLAANCIADDDGDPDGWKMMIGPRHLDFWVTSGMKRTTADDDSGVEVPATHLELLVRAVDVANGLLRAWEDIGAPTRPGTDRG
jgi:hypothetical protein